MFFGIGWPPEWGSLVVFVVAGVVCFAALGVAFAHAIPNFESTAAYVNAVFLPVVFVSFYVFDSSSAPEFVRTIAEALPLYPLIDGLSGAMVTGTSLSKDLSRSRGDRGLGRARHLACGARVQLGAAAETEGLLSRVRWHRWRSSTTCTATSRRSRRCSPMRAAAGAQRFLLGGDYALFGPFQAECVAALRALDAGAPGSAATSTVGPRNPDDLPRTMTCCCGRSPTAERRSATSWPTQLGGLPEQVVIDGTRYCHASPLSDMRSFLPEPGDDDEEMLAGAAERRVVFGHTHLQFRRSGPGGVELLNPGQRGAAARRRRARGVRARPRRRVDRAPPRRVRPRRAIGALQERFGDVAWAQRTVRRLQTSRP